MRGNVFLMGGGSKKAKHVSFNKSREGTALMKKEREREGGGWGQGTMKEQKNKIKTPSRLIRQNYKPSGERRTNYLHFIEKLSHILFVSMYAYLKVTVHRCP